MESPIYFSKYIGGISLSIKKYDEMCSDDIGFMFLHKKRAGSKREDFTSK